jgi:hypothetical protein
MTTQTAAKPKAFTKSDATPQAQTARPLNRVSNQKGKITGTRGERLSYRASLLINLMLSTAMYRLLSLAVVSIIHLVARYF